MLGITNHSKVPAAPRHHGRLRALRPEPARRVHAYVVLKLIFWQQFELGLAPLVVGMFFFGSVQLFFIGILGEYIGAIHTQVLKRPHVVELERINF